MRKLLFVFLLASSVCQAQISASEIDQLVERTRTTFNVPGIAVAVIKDNQVIHAKGYGVASLKNGTKVDVNTLFGIASNSKAFTTAALAIMVDEGKLNWDDKVVKWLPDFKMYNDYVTDEFTIRDLLTHRSGLGLGAGDLMIWPDRNDFTTDDIIYNLRFLKPVSAFRTKYDYDNLLYIVAGEVLHKASGMSWADFIETRIMKPLQMNQSAASFVRLRDTANVIDPHVPTDGKLKAIARYKGQTFDAAAGIYSSINDLSKWVMMQLNGGHLKTGQALFSEKQQSEMWTSQTILPNAPSFPYKSNFKTYGLGWQISDINGFKQVSHTGGLDGIVTQILLIPELKLGIIVLTNQQSGAAFTAISNTIKDRFMGLADFDHIANLSKQRKEKEDSADKITDQVWATVALNHKDKRTPEMKRLTGQFKDNWFGEINLRQQKGRLYFESKRSPQLSGEVFFYKDHTFAVKWNNRSFLADAFLTFSADGDQINMKPISPLTDFSYDFQDLEFYRLPVNK